MKILIINYYMKFGGIATSLINLINYLIQHKDIEINLLLFNDELDERYSLPKEVKLLRPSYLLRTYSKSFRDILKRGRVIDKLIAILLHALAKLFGEEKLINFLLRFEKKITDIDIVISFTNDIHYKGKIIGRKFSGGCNSYAINCVDAKKKIGWVHNDPSHLGMTYDICKNTYEEFDLIVFVSASCRDSFINIIPEYTFKTTVVYNMIDKEKINYLSNEFNPYEHNKTNIVTVGRIDNQQKRIDRIIKCCELLKKNGRHNYKWTIVGDGPDIKWLKEFAIERGVIEYIDFVGKKSNPYPFIKYADFLVMTSCYEANSMVLLEASALGTPIICTNYPSAQEIVNHNTNGILVENSTEGVYQGVSKFLNDTNFVDKLREDSKKITSNNGIVDQQLEYLIRNLIV